MQVSGSRRCQMLKPSCRNTTFVAALLMLSWLGERASLLRPPLRRQQCVQGGNSIRPACDGLPTRVRLSATKMKEEEGGEAATKFPSSLPTSGPMQQIHDDAASLQPVGVPSLTTAFLLLNGVAIIWGSQHTVIKSTLEAFPTSSLNFWRFTSSALFFVPSLAAVVAGGGRGTSIQGERERERVLRGGLELGIYTFLGFGFQSIGLETTSASRSAFLLYLNVKFVPFLAAVIYKREIPARVWGSAALALAGTWLLSTDQGQGPFNSGDAWCVLAALASAAFILRLEGISREVSSASELTSVSSACVALLCGLWAVGDVLSGGGASGGGGGGGGGGTDALTASILRPFLDNPWPALYLGVVTTSICGWLQVQGQRRISAEKAAIIYSMDPLYGAAFSSYFLGERFGPAGICGGLCILAGVVLSSLGAGAGSERDDQALAGMGMEVKTELDA